MRRLVEAFGFELRRSSGSHHVFVHPDVRELLNLPAGDLRAIATPSTLRTRRNASNVTVRAHGVPPPVHPREQEKLD